MTSYRTDQASALSGWWVTFMGLIRAAICAESDSGKQQSVALINILQAFCGDVDAGAEG
jgi:hypothetical protein